MTPNAFTLLLVLVGTAALPVRANEPSATVHLGPGEARLTAPAREVCGSVLLTSGGDYVTAITWQDEGVQPPYYGAFAECYSGHWNVCAAVFDLAGIYPGLPPTTLDAYLWRDAGGQPGEVLCLVTDIDPGPIALWPEVSRHEVQFPQECCVEDNWWIGYWPNWPNDQARWLVATGDIEQGCPYTNVAPGIGYPSGWQHVELIWGPGHSCVGIGAEVLPCEPTPAVPTSWGMVKELFSADRHP